MRLARSFNYRVIIRHLNSITDIWQYKNMGAVLESLLIINIMNDVLC